MIDNFITYIKCIRGYSANTCKAYERDLRQFVSWMKEENAEARWSTITRHDIDAYIIYLSSTGAKASTSNRAISSISSIYIYFQREGMDIDNPCKFESRRKLPEQVPNTIPMNDLKRAFDNNKGAVRSIIGILATTGIRLQEMLDITWEDINLSENSIMIHGKGQKGRIVYTTDIVLEPFKELCKHIKPHGRIFGMSQRKVRNLLYEALRPYTRAKQISPHAIRHTYATELAKQGYNVATISKALGHKHLETTQKYIDMAQVETASKCLSNIIN